MNPIGAVVRANIDRIVGWMLIAAGGIVVGKVQNGKFAPKANDPDKFTCPPGWKAAG